MKAQSSFSLFLITHASIISPIMVLTNHLFSLDLNASLVETLLFSLLLIFLLLLELLLIKRLFLAEVDAEEIYLGGAKIHWSRLNSVFRLYILEIILIKWRNDAGKMEFAMFPISTMPLVWGLVKRKDDGILHFLEKAREQYNI